MAVATSNVIGGGDARSTQWLRSGRLDRPAPERIDSNQEISVLDFFRAHGARAFHIGRG